MKLIISCFPNNELRVTRQTDTAKSNPASSRDTPRERRSAKLDALRQRRQYLTKLIDSCVFRPDKSAHFLSCSLPASVQTSLLPSLSSCDPGFRLLSPVFGVDVIESTSSGQKIAFVDQSSLLAERSKLDIYLESQRAKPRSHSDTWGQGHPSSRLTLNARHQLLQTAAVFDELYPGSQYVCTTTLPGSTVAAKDALARWSGWIVNRQLQVLRRLRSTAPISHFFVWELQKRGALHQHWCLASLDADKARQAAELIKDCFYSCLTEIGEKEGIDLFERWYGGTWANQPGRWQWDVQPVLKSCGAYFGKYASKDALACSVETGKPYSAVHPNFCPSRWWGRSRDSKKAVSQRQVLVRFDYISESESDEIEQDVLSLIDAGVSVSISKSVFEVGGLSPSSDFAFKSTTLRCFLSPGAIVDYRNRLASFFASLAGRYFSDSRQKFVPFVAKIFGVMSCPVSPSANIAVNAQDISYGLLHLGRDKRRAIYEQ